MKKLTYAQAINETFRQIMEKDKSVFLIGQGVTSPWYVGSTTVSLLDMFGEKRVIDTPVSENGITGAAIGAAIAGMRPIVVHPRMDFMYLAMDQIINHAGNWYYMFGSRVHVPLTIWGIINRGGEQSAQHSQAIHSMFAHAPGLKVVMPSTPYDVKGLLISSIFDDNPVIFVDDRWLYSIEGDVPKEIYTIPIGKGIVRKEGKDVTIVAMSYMVHEALKAAIRLADEGIDVEVIDLRSIKPIDESILLDSVKKTGRLIIVDGGWKTCGMAAEISALVSENVFEYLRSRILRVTLPDTPAPASSELEKDYYPTWINIVNDVKKIVVI